MEQSDFKKNIKIGGLLRSQKELGEIANEIMFLLSQRQVLHFEVKEIFEMIEAYLKHAPISYNDIVSSLEGKLDPHK